jgi:hypothetical protein
MNGITMPSTLDARRLLEESVPAAVVLLFWSLLAVIDRGLIGTGLRLAGVVMALLYVVVRGTRLADSLTDDGQPVEPEPVLRENATVALAAGAWFVAAALATVALHLVGVGLMIEALESVAEALRFALAATGVATVGLYAVAVGTVRLHDRSESAGPAPSATNRE